MVPYIGPRDPKINSYAPMSGSPSIALPTKSVCSPTSTPVLIAGDVDVSLKFAPAALVNRGSATNDAASPDEPAHVA